MRSNERMKVSSAYSNAMNADQRFPCTCNGRGGLTINKPFGLL
jgi:hypothetical protein